MRCQPDRVPAAELSGALGLKPSTLFAHHSALRRYHNAMGHAHPLVDVAMMLRQSL